MNSIITKEPHTFEYTDVPLVSVIMPLYNAKQYIYNTVVSILNQRYRNLELIVIDDGSTDGSGDVCKDIMQGDSRLKYYFQPNAGCCAARNRGLELAKGDFIAFCDHDDLWDDALLSDNVKILAQTDVDYIKFGRSHYANSRLIAKTEFSELSLTLYDSKEYLSLYPYFVSQKLNVYIWDGIYRTEFLHNAKVRFDESLRHGEEDKRFNCDCMRALNRIAINPSCYYTHFTHSISTSSKPRIDIFESIIDSAKYEIESLKDKYGKSEIEAIVPSVVVASAKALSNALTNIPNSQFPASQKCAVLQRLVDATGLKEYDSNYLTHEDEMIGCLLRSGKHKMILLLSSMNRVRHTLGVKKPTGGVV